MMSVQELKEMTYGVSSMKDWAAKAEKSLKGRLVKDLKTSVIEGFELNPVYTKGETAAETPGAAPYTRGISTKSYEEEPWKMAQPIAGHQFEQVIGNVRLLPEKGINCVNISFLQLAEWKEEEILRFFTEIQDSGLSVFIDTKGGQKALVSLLHKLPPAVLDKLDGVVAEDPIALGLRRGKGVMESSSCFKDWLRRIDDFKDAAPNLKTVLIDSTVIHNAGGHAVQELAMALSTAVEYLHHAEELGIDTGEIARKMMFCFSMDSSYFMNISKLRAARRLWSLVGETFNGNKEDFKMHIHCETSSFTSTVFDRHVNLLRAGNQAFAAVVGGAQSIRILHHTSAAFDKDPSAERIAANIHLILKEEMLLDKVIDPAGGSYYIEALTDNIAEKAWEAFLQIENEGGVLEALRKGTIQKQVKQTFNEKKEKAAKREISIVGTNVYADLKDVPERKESSELEAALPFETTDIIALEAVRLSEDFEKMRIASINFKRKQGVFPQVGLICAGPLKSYKPRADFIKGFLAAGGIEAVEKQCGSPDETISFIKGSHLQHYIFCGSDAIYEEEVLSWMTERALGDLPVTLFMAGQMKGITAQQFHTLGIKNYISAKSDMVTTLTGILKDLEVM